MSQPLRYHSETLSFSPRQPFRLEPSVHAALNTPNKMPRGKQPKPNCYAPLIAEWFQQGLSGAEIDVELGKLREREQMEAKLEAETEAEKDWVAAIKARNAEKRGRDAEKQQRLDAKGFQKFPSLPMELQVMIWKVVIKNEPMHIGEEDSYIDYDEVIQNIHPWLYSYSATRRGPAVMAACILSRLLALKAWIKHLDHCLNDQPRRSYSYGLSGDWVLEKWKVLLMEYVKAFEEGRAPVKPCEEYWSWRLQPVLIDPGRWPDLGPRGRYCGELRRSVCKADSWILAHENCCLDVKGYWTMVPLAQLGYDE